MKPEVKKFDRSAPCTFRHIWNCFHGVQGYFKVQVDKAHAEIGLNVPRGMEKEKRLVKERVKEIDYYSLTGIGKDWLEKGVRGHMRNHPADAHNVKHPPAMRVPGAAKRVIRRKS